MRAVGVLRGGGGLLPSRRVCKDVGRRGGGGGGGGRRLRYHEVDTVGEGLELLLELDVVTIEVVLETCRRKRDSRDPRSTREDADLSLSLSLSTLVAGKSALHDGDAVDLDLRDRTRVLVACKRVRVSLLFNPFSRERERETRFDERKRRLAEGVVCVGCRGA